MYMGHRFLFLFTIKKKEFKNFVAASSDRIHKLAVLHQPYVLAHDVKNGVLNYYLTADKSKSRNYSTYGIYKGKPYNKTRLIFRKGKFLHMLNIENGEYIKQEMVGSSFKELNKEESYKFIERIYQGKSLSGDWPLAINTSLTEVFQSEYHLASFTSSGIKEKRKLKAVKQSFNLYSKRDKTLAEQVLNYTTSGDPEGKKIIIGMH